jgi:A/G-specific adenine glycosylase
VWLFLLPMKFSQILFGWYQKNKRNLPWRQTCDPYKIWLSEIILQQTRIEQGRDYYMKFIRLYPDVRSLADASEHDILKHWQGLGYYFRARNLHKTAGTIAHEFCGQFPDKYDSLLKLKGIGEYTAAAIASIAYGEPRPVVDGNVLRFLSRYHGIKTPVNSNSGKKEITEIAIKLIDRTNPGEFNQAMMEFGALYCKPQNPNCGDCTFKTECKAHLDNHVNSIPQKIKRLSPRKRYFHYLFIIYKNKSVYLKKRSGNDIWKNLYDFPLIEKKGKISMKKMIQEVWDYVGMDRENNQQIKISSEFKHILTHQVISARFYRIGITDRVQFIKINSKHGDNFVSVGLNEIQTYPVSRLIEKYLKNNQIL